MTLQRPKFKITIRKARYWPWRLEWTMADWNDRYIDSDLTFRKPTYERVLELHNRKQEKKLAKDRRIKETEELLK